MLGSCACREQATSLERPNRALLDGAGRLHVSDFHHQRVLVFGDGPAPVASYGHQGLGEDGLWQVYALTDAGERGVWVTQQRIRAPGDEEVVWETKRFADGHQQEVHPLPLAEGQEEQWAEALIPAPGGGWWVVDSAADAIVRYDEGFAPVEVIRSPRATPEDPAPEPFLGLASAALVGEHLWTLEQRTHRVRRLDLSLRQQLAFGSEGQAPGELRFPQALAVCDGQWLAVADLGNYRVQRFDLEGRYLDGFEPTPAREGLPVQLLDLQLSPDCGTLYLVDSKGCRVLATSPTGAPRGVWSAWGSAG